MFSSFLALPTPPVKGQILQLSTMHLSSLIPAGFSLCRETPKVCLVVEQPQGGVCVYPREAAWKGDKSLHLLEQSDPLSVTFGTHGKILLAGMQPDFQSPSQTQ